MEIESHNVYKWGEINANDNDVVITPSLSCFGRDRSILQDILNILAQKKVIVKFLDGSDVHKINEVLNR
jgi:DNA invertase Pin-like site-specific DNA recombinase